MLRAACYSTTLSWLFDRALCYRIVIVSALAYEYGAMNWEDLNWEKSYDRIKAYSQSKLANVLHAAELSRRVAADGVSVYALHPGTVATDLQRHVGGTWLGRAVVGAARPFLKTPRQGAQTALFCCLEEAIAGDSGRYYSDCREKRMSRRASSAEDQRRLWEVSERMVGLKPGP